MMVLGTVGSVHSDQPHSDTDGPEPVAAAVNGCGLRDGELYFQRCRWCRAAVYQKLLCPYCGSTDLREERSSGTGLVRRTSAARTGNGAQRRRAWIEMSEGFHLRATVIGLSPLTTGEWVPVHLQPEMEDASRGLVFRFTDEEPPAQDWR